MKTLQQIFDVAWQKFIVEDNAPGIGRDANDRWHCAYQTPDGSRCAIGWSIPDDHPALRAENSFSCVAHINPELFDVEQWSHKELDRFQADLHDELHNDGKWPAKPVMERAYRKVAARMGLSIPGDADGA